ncbi:MAG: hypothetical protein JF593_02855 [Novosphingobium sp.]|nr:hypothetical protein [Novosphingobium sp.]
MLDQLQPGHWELRLRDTAGPVRSVCVHDGRELIQLRHPGPSCERYIVDDGDKDVTVQYTCRGRGYGRTHIRRESAQLAQIETQGIAEALPFNFVVEARRTGDCSA